MEYVFQIGDFGLRWYSVLIAVGVAAGTYVAASEARRHGESTEHVINVLFLAIPLALIGARAYHVIDQWNEIYSNDIPRVFLINQGGIGIYGTVAGGILAVIIYTRWKRLNLSRWLDIGAPGLILGQAIGRWGNFFNEELYGRPTDLPWAITIPVEKRLLGYGAFDSFHPLFLYESLLNFAALGLMLYAGRRWVGRLKAGDIALMYGLFYGAIRLGLENLRIDNWKVADVPIATVISAAAVVGCGGALLYRHWWAPRHRKAADATSVEG